MSKRTTERGLKFPLGSSVSVEVLSSLQGTHSLSLPLCCLCRPAIAAQSRIIASRFQERRRDLIVGGASES